MELDLLERSLKTSSRDYVYETIHTNILNLKLTPGMLVSENDFTQILKVSRTPLREAFVKLSEEGLIDIYPQRGSFISRIDLEQIEEARFVRENMEVAVARLACELFTEDDHEDMEAILERQRVNFARNNHEKLLSLDEEFHRTLFEKCGKPRTWVMVQQMQMHYKRLRLLLMSINKKGIKSVSQHARILECIRLNDRDLVEQEMRNHLRLFTSTDKEDFKAMFPNYIK